MNGFEIRAAADGAKATIYIYEDIGESWYSENGLTAKRFADELKELGNKVRELNVRINCVGGSVFDARAMASLLRDHPAKVAVDIDGVCASAATFIACVGETCSIAEDGVYMVHAPSGVCMGPASEMRKMAESLDVIQGGMVEVYSKRTKRDEKEINKLINAETWMDATMAKELGFVDSISETRKLAAKAQQAKLPNNRLPFHVPDRFKERVTVVDASATTDAYRERVANMKRKLDMDRARGMV